MGVGGEQTCKINNLWSDFGSQRTLLWNRINSEARFQFPDLCIDCVKPRWDFWQQIRLEQRRACRTLKTETMCHGSTAMFSWQSAASPLPASLTWRMVKQGTLAYFFFFFIKWLQTWAFQVTRKELHWFGGPVSFRAHVRAKGIHLLADAPCKDICTTWTCSHFVIFHSKSTVYNGTTVCLRIFVWNVEPNYLRTF